MSELENRNDGKFEIIDVKLNNRKTRTSSDAPIKNEIDNLITKNNEDESITDSSNTITFEEFLKNSPAISRIIYLYSVRFASARAPKVGFGRKGTLKIINFPLVL